MSIFKKPHISKTGKSILAFRRQTVASAAATVQREMKDGQIINRTPAVLIDFVSDPSRAYGK